MHNKTINESGKDTCDAVPDGQNTSENSCGTKVKKQVDVDSSGPVYAQTFIDQHEHQIAVNAVADKSTANPCDAMPEPQLSRKVTHFDFDRTAPLFDGEIFSNQQACLSAMNVDANADVNAKNISVNPTNTQVDTILNTSGNRGGVNSLTNCDVPLDGLAFIDRQGDQKVQLGTTSLATTIDTAAVFADEKGRYDCSASGTTAAKSCIETKSDCDCESESEDGTESSEDNDSGNGGGSEEGSSSN